MKIKLVKYNYDELPVEWKAESVNIFKDVVFARLGKVKGMKKHYYLQDIETGKTCILHSDMLKKIKV